MSKFKYYTDDYCIDVMKEDPEGNWADADDLKQALELLSKTLDEIDTVIYNQERDENCYPCNNNYALFEGLTLIQKELKKFLGDL